MNDFLIEIRKTYKKELVRKLQELVNDMFSICGSNEINEIIYDGEIKTAPHIVEITRFENDFSILLMYHNENEIVQSFDDLSIDVLEEILSSKLINFSDKMFRPYILDVKENRLILK